MDNRDHVELVLGVITSKDPALEDVDAVIARIHEAAELVPLKNLGISTQCGFASTEEGNILTEQDEWNKLKLIKQLLIKFGHNRKNTENRLSLFSLFMNIERKCYEL